MPAAPQPCSPRLAVLPPASPCSLPLGSGAQRKLPLNFTLLGWGSAGAAGELSLAAALLPPSPGFASGAGCDPSPVWRPARALDSREPLPWRGVNHQEQPVVAVVRSAVLASAVTALAKRHQ